MIRTWAILASGIAAAFGAVTADAATFNADFTMTPVVDGFGVTRGDEGMVQLFADADVDGGYRVTGATGILRSTSSVPDDLFSKTFSVTGASGRLFATSTGFSLAGISPLSFRLSGSLTSSIDPVGRLVSSYFKAVDDDLTGTKYTLDFGEFQGATYTVTVTSAVTAVPEPATWALMALGFGLTGLAVRRRRKLATSVRFA